jgi:long-chain acyl-CoA synthetase
MQLRQTARADPDRPAVVRCLRSTTLTFAELEATANQLAHHFRGHGLRTGDVSPS